MVVLSVHSPILHNVPNIVHRSANLTRPRFRTSYRLALEAASPCITVVSLYGLGDFWNIGLWITKAILGWSTRLILGSDQRFKLAKGNGYNITQLDLRAGACVLGILVYGLEVTSAATVCKIWCAYAEADFFVASDNWVFSSPKINTKAEADLYKSITSV